MAWNGSVSSGRLPGASRDPVSDIDVLVEFTAGHATLRNFVSLADHLEALFKRKVDLSTREGLDRYIRPHIEAEVIWVEG